MLTPNPSRQEEVEKALDIVESLPPDGLMTVELGKVLARSVRSWIAEVTRLQKELSSTSEASAQHCADAVRLAKDFDRARDSWEDFKFRLVNCYGGPSPYLKIEEMDAALREKSK